MADQHEAGTSHAEDHRRHLVVVANRLPVRQVAETPGAWESSPGGLVSALEPAVSTSNTSWVGWSGVPGPAPAPFSFETPNRQGIDLHPVELSSDELQDYYNGFANSTLWPLYHDAIVVPQFEKSWWNAYVAVNQRFAEATASVARRDSIVWIHDYQLQLVPGMLRALRPDLRIGFYLHIPFPAQELFLRLPWRTEIVRGLLGADVIGFQTVVGAQNFRAVAKRLLGAPVFGRYVAHDGRRSLVHTYPVGIDAEHVRSIAAEQATIDRAHAIREELGSPTTVLLGVDRLDYTKGIEVRLRAFRELLMEGRLDPAQTVMVQIAQPTRDDAPGYAEIRTAVEQLVGSINGDFGNIRGSVVTYLHQSQSFRDVVALYLAADVMVVTPFRDGMNLVAKEFVASRLDNSGELVLSEFAGAAHQLRRATLVNPFDVDALKTAIERAVTPDVARQRRAMSVLRRGVHEHDAARWSADFLRDLEQA
ncbi:MAG: trehalose-6-phosphate synthase [Ilumatobacteraceae bacterium]